MVVVPLSSDIDSLNDQVNAFANEHTSKQADLAPKPLARALSYVCERFDIPISAYAVEHTTVFADNAADICP